MRYGPGEVADDTSDGEGGRLSRRRFMSEADVETIPRVQTRP